MILYNVTNIVDANNTIMLQNYKTGFIKGFFLKRIVKHSFISRNLQSLHYKCKCVRINIYSQ